MEFIKQLQALFQIQHLKQQLNDKSVSQQEKALRIQLFNQEILTYSVASLMTYRLVQVMHYVRKVLTLKYLDELQAYVPEKDIDIADRIISSYIADTLSGSLPILINFLQQNIQPVIQQFSKQDLSELLTVVDFIRKLCDASLANEIRPQAVSNKYINLTNYTYKDVEEAYMFGLKHSSKPKKSALSLVLDFINPFKKRSEPAI